VKNIKILKRANEYFGIPLKKYEATGAFNPVIGIDSLFFVDPLLLNKTAIPEFEQSLNKVREYFSISIALLGLKNIKARLRAEKLLVLREVKGIGIGYGSTSDDGSAIGPKLAHRLADTATELIEMGITDPAIFEVMGLFEEDFGPDRLSDALIRILLKDIYQYTARITKELGIKNLLRLRTYEANYILPEHPLKKGKPLVFLPKNILRDLPVANNYEEIANVAAFNEELRKRFNQIVAACFAGKNKPKKSDFKSYLLSEKDRIETLVKAYQTCQPQPYNFGADPVGLYLWLEKAKEIVIGEPLQISKAVKSEDLDDVVKKIIDAFKKAIEKKGVWRSLYDGQMKPLNESHARHFFYATALLYCEQCNVDISPESNAGQGPVDFKLSRSGSEKIVVEVKLTSGHVKQGYEKQTRAYQESEEAQRSYYVVIQVIEKSKPLDDILKLSQEEDREDKAHPTIITVDGRERPSASKIKFLQ
jgi:hypothetical protein